MTGAVRYQILADIRLVVVCVIGDAGGKDGSAYLASLTQHPDFDPTFDNITDFSYASLEFDQKQLLTFADYLKAYKAYNGRRREAYIVQAASEVVKLSIFSIYARYSPIEFNVVTSLREAMEFIGVPMEHSQMVEETITALRNL